MLIFWGEFLGVASTTTSIVVVVVVIIAIHIVDIIDIWFLQLLLQIFLGSFDKIGMLAYFTNLRNKRMKGRTS